MAQQQRTKERFTYALTFGLAGGCLVLVAFILLILVCAAIGGGWPSFVLPSIICGIIGWYKSGVHDGENQSDS